MRSFLLASWLLLCVSVAWGGVNQWTGKSAEWSAAENWSTGKIPAANDGNDVLIPAGLPVCPVLSKDAVVDGSVTIDKGASLALAGHRLSLTRLNVENKSGVTNKGTLDATGGPAMITVGRGGFINEGKVLGSPGLTFQNYCLDATLVAGGATLSSLSFSPGNASYQIQLKDKLIVDGNVTFAGNALVVAENASLTINKDLVFTNEKPNAALVLNGEVVLRGNLTGGEAALCGGNGKGWLTLAGEGEQTITAGGILPPIKIARQAGAVKVTGDLSCAGLWITKGNTLDLTACKTLRFGGAGATTPGCRGLINEGTINGEPSLLFAGGVYNGLLTSGGTRFAGMTIDTGNYAYSVQPTDPLVITGNLTMTTGSLNLGDQSLTIGGSFTMAPVTQDAVHPRFYAGKKAVVTMTSPANALLSIGGGMRDQCFTDLVIDKPGATLQLKGLVALNGKLALKAGAVQPVEGGQIWTGLLMKDQQVVDATLRITSPINSEIFPAITGEFAGDTAALGPAIPADVKLVNVAAAANITTMPYMTMARTLVDQDNELRTLSEAELGTPFKGERIELHFPKAISIAAVKYAIPLGAWAISVDQDGDGKYERLLRADLEGKLVMPLGSWGDRKWLNNTFWPPVQAFGVQVTNPTGELYLYDLQILSPSDKVTIPLPALTLAQGVPAAEAGDTLQVADPPVAQQFMKGYHIEPWMFGLGGWVKMNPRPPLNEYVGFKNLIDALRKTHANYVNLWPPRAIETPRGKGTYESDVLWPSKYDKWSTSENLLREISDAFRKEGITFFAMDRVTYPKALEEFPDTPTKKLDAPYIGRLQREYIAGFAREQAEAGASGVGIGFDEQYWRAIQYPQQASDFTKKTFEERYHLPFPDKPGDTDAYRRWILFAYDEFAGYLQGAAAAVKAVNPKTITNSPVTVLDTAWNNRIDHGVAHDVIGHTAAIDVLRASGYLDFRNIGHYVTASFTKDAIAATKSRGAISLHNCPWANDPVKFPGFYRHFPPVYMSAPPVSAFMNGAKIAAYWRENFIFYGGYDKYVTQSFSLLDTIAAWGATQAKVPQKIAVLRSRASEDWWQIRQRYNPVGDPMDQTRGYIMEKWLQEFLLSNAYPYEEFFLEHPEDFAKLSSYKLVILPFPYSISKQAYAVIADAVQKGTKVIIIDRQGETDEFGAPYAKPLFADLAAQGKVTLISDNLPVVGHYPEVEQRMRKLCDTLLGANKPVYFNSYGQDVEVSLLEKGARERFLCVINWTDHPVQVDLGVNGLPAGRYEVFMRDLNEAKRVKIGGKAVCSAADLTKFRDTLEGWAIHVFYIHPAEGK